MTSATTARLRAAAALACSLSCSGDLGAAPTALLPYGANLFVRALDVSCAPPDAQPGVQGCIALFHFQGQLRGLPFETGAHGNDLYGNVLYVRTDAAGKVLDGWPKVLMSGFAPTYRLTGTFVDEDFRVHLLANGEFLVTGSYSGRVLVGAGDDPKSQELGPGQATTDRHLFLIEFHADGTFDNWEDTGNGRALRGLSAAELPNTDLVIAGTCIGDVPLDDGSFPCGDTQEAFLLTVHYDGSTVGGIAFGGDRPAEARDVVADQDGNLYVSGTFDERMKYSTEPEDVGAGSTDAYVMKLGPDRKRLWIKTASSLGADRGGRLALVTGNGGGVLWTATVAQGAIAGKTRFPRGGHLVARLDALGNFLFAQPVPEAHGAVPLSLAARPDGSFALSGEGFLGSYAASGAALWSRTDADVPGVALPGAALAAAADTLGSSLFGVPLSGAGAADLGGALVWFPR
jgi:hypothetical protein